MHLSEANLQFLKILPEDVKKMYCAERVNVSYCSFDKNMDFFYGNGKVLHMYG